MPRLKLLIASALAAHMVAIAGGAAQTASWDNKARERSQTASSAALTSLTKGAVDQAISSLMEATGADPSDPLPFALLGLALDMKGRYAEAIDALHKSYRLAPKIGETALSIGFTHYLTHDYGKAINAWRKALEINPKLCHIYGDIGFAHLRQGDFKRGDEMFRKMIGCHPGSQLAYQGLATTRYLAGDFAAARKAADQAQSIAAYPPVLLLLAKLDVLEGDRARALSRIAEYAKTTQKPWVQRPMTGLGYPVQHDFRWDPFLADNFDNSYLLSARLQNLPRDESRRKSLARQGKVDAVRARAAAALETSPGDFYLVREMALIDLADGRYSEAAERFGEVLKYCPDCHVDLLHRARALALDGKSAEASALVRRFQRIYPGGKLSPVMVDIARVDPGLCDTDAVAPARTPVPEAPAQPTDGGF